MKKITVKSHITDLLCPHCYGSVREILKVIEDAMKIGYRAGILKGIRPIPHSHGDDHGVYEPLQRLDNMVKRNLKNGKGLKDGSWLREISKELQVKLAEDKQALNRKLNK